MILILEYRVILEMLKSTEHSHDYLKDNNIVIHINNLYYYIVIRIFVHTDR